MNTRHHKRGDGFTLIELLIVVVIIGILASIAFPRLASTRESAYFGTLQGDLRSLSKAMEMWYNANDFSYVGVSPDGAELSADGSFTPSRYVVVNIAVSPSGQGWSASAEHPGITDSATRRCAIFFRDGAPQAPSTAADDNTIVCSP